jgi:HEAT repeat protein
MGSVTRVVGVLTVLLFVGVTVLAGFVIARHAFNTRRSRTEAGLRSRWEPFVLDVLVGDRSATDVRLVVHAGEEKAFVQFLVGYSRRLAGVDRTLVLRLAEPYLWSLREDLAAGHPEVRARAVQVLSELGFEDHIVAVIGALDDPSPLVATVAARALTRPGYPELASEVTRRLERYAGWDRGFLAAMLARAGPGITPTLRAILTDEQRSDRDRSVSADALRMLNDPESAAAAVEVLARSDSTEVVAACLRLLRQVGRREHAPTIRRFADSERFAIRAHALSALGVVGGESDLGTARRALFDPSPWVALHAARALTELGERGTLRSLARMSHPRSELAREILGEEAA